MTTSDDCVTESKPDNERLPTEDNDSTFYVSLAHVLLVLAQSHMYILFTRQLNVSLTTRSAVTSKREMYVNDITACITITNRITGCNYWQIYWLII